MFNAFVASVFNADGGLWDHWSSQLDDCDCSNDKFQPALSLCEIWCCSWMHISLWGLMGFIGLYSKCWLINQVKQNMVIAIDVGSTDLGVELLKC